MTRTVSIACTITILLGVPVARQMAGSRFSHNFQRGGRMPGGAGAVIRVVYLGEGLNFIGVDEHIGRAFVLSDPGNNDGQPTGLGIVSVLDTRRGVLLHTTTVGLRPSAMVVDQNTGRVFVTVIGFRGTNVYPNDPSHGQLRILDARSGALRHTARVGAAPDEIAVDDRTGRVFVVSGASVSTLDAATGQLLRTVRMVGLGGGQSVVAQQVGHVFVTIYEPSSVAMFDATTGCPIRALRVGDHPDSIAVDEQTERVFVADQTSAVVNDVNVLDARSGALLRTTAVGFGLSTIIVDDRTQRIFILDLNGIAMLDTRTGALLRRDTMNRYRGQAGGIALNARAGRLYVTTDRGLLVLDARTGVILHNVAVGQATGAIAVDTQRQRAIVINGSRNSISVIDTTKI